MDTKVHSAQCLMHHSSVGGAVMARSARADEGLPPKTARKAGIFWHLPARTSPSDYT